MHVVPYFLNRGLLVYSLHRIQYVQAESRRCHRRLHVAAAEEEDRDAPQQQRDSKRTQAEQGSGAPQSREPVEEEVRDFLRDYVSTVVAPREVLRRLTACVSHLAAAFGKMVLYRVQASALHALLLPTVAPREK